MASGTHQYQQDTRNDNILININGELFPRSEAKISVFDSGFILGDGVWEGIRLHNGQLAFIEQHMRRLYDGAKALDMDIGLSSILRFPATTSKSDSAGTYVGALDADYSSTSSSDPSSSSSAMSAGK